MKAYLVVCLFITRILTAPAQMTATQRVYPPTPEDEAVCLRHNIQRSGRVNGKVYLFYGSNSPASSHTRPNKDPNAEDFWEEITPTDLHVELEDGTILGGDNFTINPVSHTSFSVIGPIVVYACTTLNEPGTWSNSKGPITLGIRY